MPYVAEIKISATTELEAIEKAGQAIDRLKRTTSSGADAANKASKEFTALSERTKVLSNEKLGAARAAQALATSVAGLGPAGSVASNALIGVATGAGLAGAAAGGLSTAIVLLIQNFQEARRKKEEFDQVLQSRDLGQLTAGITAADTALVGLNERLDDTRRRLAESRAAGVRGDGFLESLQAALQGEASGVGRDRSSLVGAREQVLEARARQTVLALEFERAAVGANIREQEELNHQRRIATAFMGDYANASQATKDAIQDESLALRDRNIAERQRKEAEEASKRTTAELEAQRKQLANAEAAAMQAMLQSEQALQLQVIALTQGTDAAARHRIEVEANTIALKLGAEAADAFSKRQLARLSTINENTRALREQAEALQFSKDLGARLDSEEAVQKDANRAAIAAVIQTKERELELDIVRLRAAGLHDEAAKRELQNIININNERKRQLDEAANAGMITRQPGEIPEIQQRIDIAQIKMQQLGQTSIDVAGEVARVVTDITSAVVNGTLKWSEIGRSVLASFVRVALEQFTGFLRTMQSAARAAQMSGANGMVGGASVGSVPGGGGTGLFGGIGDFFSNLFNGGSFGFGSAPPGVAGPTMANGGFFSNPLGALSNGSFSLGGAALGGGIGLLTALATGGFSSQRIGSTIGSTVGGIAGSFFGPIGSVVGSVLGNLLGGLFNDIPNPSVWVNSVVKFYYDAAVGAFNALNEATILRFRDIGGGKAQQVLAEHQKIMDGVSRQFVDLLNTFPTAVHDNVVPFLDEANRILDAFLGGKKYSEGGSRSIRQELDDLRQREAPAAFFLALRQGIGAGIGGSLGRAGFDLSGTIAQAFPAPERLAWLRGGTVDFGSGLNLPTDPEESQKFIQALQQFVSFSGTLGGISPRGVQPFLTAFDQQRLQGELEGVLQARGSGFTTAVDSMLDRVKPVSDFLAQSVTEASNLFGRGMIAALEAATASQANQAFLQSLGEGVKEKIFQGITESFIASAQFTDLLAPIQQTIREFTQEAIATGETPDIGAFRRAILPDVEGIASRAENLRPLIDELHRLGVDVRDALRALSGAPASVGPIRIDIHGGGMRFGDPMWEREFAQQVSRALGNLIHGRLGPM